MRTKELETTKELEMTLGTIMDNLRMARINYKQFIKTLEILEQEDGYVADEDDEKLLKELEAKKLHWEALHEEHWEKSFQESLEYEKKLKEQRELRAQKEEELKKQKAENVKIRKKDGSLNSHAIKAINWCLFEKAKGGKYKVYTKEWTGSGSYFKLIDYTPRIIALLKERNYKYTEGNDSKQGGQNSYYIEISKLAYNYIQDELNKYK